MSVSRKMVASLLVSVFCFYTQAMADDEKKGEYVDKTCASKAQGFVPFSLDKKDERITILNAQSGHLLYICVQSTDGMLQVLHGNASGPMETLYTFTKSENNVPSCAYVETRNNVALQLAIPEDPGAAKGCYRFIQ